MNLRFAKFAIRYAMRSLWRNRRRTLLTLATVALSVTVSIVANRYSVAIMKIWQEGAADTGNAHAQIHAKGYWQKQEGIDESLTLRTSSQIEQRLAGDSFVKATAQRLRFEGIISSGEKTMYFLGIGVEPIGEVAVSPRLFNPQNDLGVFVNDQDRRAVTVGRGLAESLDLELGDEATLITQTVGGSVNGIDVIIAGIVNVPLPSFSKRVVYTHIDYARRLLRMKDLYTELAIKVEEEPQLESWLAAQRGFIEDEGAEIRGWWDIQPLIRKVEAIWNGIVGVVCFLLFVSATFSVLNIIYMLVAERTVEIGTLMAIGARPMDIRRLFSLEAALIGCIGGATGVLIGNIIVIGMGVAGVPFDNPFGSGEVIVFPTVSIVISAAVFFAAIVICMGAALSPSRKAASVEPVKAFRGQLT